MAFWSIFILTLIAWMQHKGEWLFPGVEGAVLKAKINQIFISLKDEEDALGDRTVLIHLVKSFVTSVPPKITFYT